MFLPKQFKHVILSLKITHLLLLVVVFLAFFSLPVIPGLIAGNENYGLRAERPVSDFVSKKVSGEAFQLSDLNGRYVYMMFGYMNCDEVCHSQALLFQELNAIADQEGLSPVFLYMNMDPERDDAEKLAKYFDSYADNFISLRSTTLKEAQAVAMDFNAFFSKTAPGKGGDYLINHPGFVFLIDPDGNLRFTYTSSQRQAYRIIEDLKRIHHQKITLF